MLSLIKRYPKDVNAIWEALRPNSENRDLSTDLLVPAANVVFLPVVLLWLLAVAIFSIFEISGNSAGTFGDSFNVLNSLLSGLALGAIALSLFLQRSDLKATLDEMQQTTAAMQEQARYLQYERDMGIREFAGTFQSQPLKDARTSAYILRPAFFKDAEFRSVLANQWIDGEDVDLPEKWVNVIVDANHGRVTEDKVRSVRNHTWHLSDLIEYYSTLQQHCSSLEPNIREATAKRLGDKYIWAYWRGMLLLLAFEVAKLYEEKIRPEQRDHFPLPHWLPDLIEFDRWVMPSTYKPNMHPREKDYSDGSIEFDYEFLLRVAASSNMNSDQPHESTTMPQS